MDEELKVKLESEGVNEPSLEEMPVQDSESDNHDKFMEHYQEMPLWKISTGRWRNSRLSSRR